MFRDGISTASASGIPWRKIILGRGGGEIDIRNATAELLFYVGVKRGSNVTLVVPACLVVATECHY